MNSTKQVEKILEYGRKVYDIPVETYTTQKLEF